jgi:cell wall-associated NlpC family hydrolase
MITSIVATSVVPGPAGADPMSDKKAEAAALAQRINADARQVEVLAEQFNGAQYHVDEVQKQLADAAQRLTATEATTELNRAALAKEAVTAYMHGGVTTSHTMKSFSGAVDFAVQEGYFRLATRNQVDALDQLRQSERSLRQQHVALQAAQRDSQAALAEVASRQQAVQAAAAASQATLSQVQGDLVQLVSDQQAQVAAQQQVQLKASLLAAQAKLAATGVATPAAGAAPSTPAPAAASTATHPANVATRPSTTAATPVTKSTASPTTKAAPTTAPPTTSVTKKPPPPPPPPPAPSSGAAAALAYARAQIGKPYQWGGAGPDAFDCSGLTMRAWEAGGVSLPHYARAQYADTAHVAIADLQPGDLVFYGSDLHHVGLYIGGGQMIDAPSTGEFVRTESIFRSDLQPYGGRPG